MWRFWLVGRRVDSVLSEGAFSPAIGRAVKTELQRPLAGAQPRFTMRDSHLCVCCCRCSWMLTCRLDMIYLRSNGLSKKIKCIDDVLVTFFFFFSFVAYVLHCRRRGSTMRDKMCGNREPQHHEVVVGPRRHHVFKISHSQSFPGFYRILRNHTE